MCRTDGVIESSYRLGVRQAACHELYPSFVTEALQRALRKFDRLMPGFVCKGNEWDGPAKEGMSGIEGSLSHSEGVNLILVQIQNSWKH